MENLCSRVSAYLYIGASVQMAFSLGLHRDQLAESATTMEREQSRRIWWTLFILDQELASRGGSPYLIDERFTKVTVPASSEQVCSTGSSMFHDHTDTLTDVVPWIAHSVRMARHFCLALSLEARDHSSCLHRAPRKFDLVFHRIELSAAAPKMVSPNAGSSQIRCTYPANAQACSRCPTSAILEHNDSPYSTFHPLPCDQEQRTCRE
jgi:hypothetical protein